MPTIDSLKLTLVRSQKSLKIDLNNEYPCPCRRRGRLLPIVLTEALGCDRCQQIFVVDEKDQVIEQLSSSYPYKRTWRWTGYRWLPAHRGFGDGYLGVASSISLVLLMLWLLLALRTGLSLIIVTAIAVFLIFLLVIILGFAYRR